MWVVTLLFCVVPPAAYGSAVSHDSKVTETYTRHQAVTPTFILKCDNWKICKNSKAYYMHKRVHLSQTYLQVARWVRLCEIKLLRPASRCDQKRRHLITDGCVGLLATFVVLTEAELSLIGSALLLHNDNSSLCNSNADDTPCRNCTYEIELLRLLGSGHILT